jgi:hypothetical protein
MKNTWKHGISQVRLYDPYGPGDVSKYLSKGRFSSAADCESANTYELRKFNRADWIYVSPGAWAEMGQARTVAIRMLPSVVNVLQNRCHVYITRAEHVHGG